MRKTYSKVCLLLNVDLNSKIHASVPLESYCIRHCLNIDGKRAAQDSSEFRGNSYIKTFWIPPFWIAIYLAYLHAFVNYEGCDFLHCLFQGNYWNNIALTVNNIRFERQNVTWLHWSYLSGGIRYTKIMSCVDTCVRSRCQGQGQVITPHRICGM